MSSSFILQWCLCQGRASSWPIAHQSSSWLLRSHSASRPSFCRRLGKLIFLLDWANLWRSCGAVASLLNAAYVLRTVTMSGVVALFKLQCLSSLVASLGWWSEPFAARLAKGAILVASVRLLRALVCERNSGQIASSFTIYSLGCYCHIQLSLQLARTPSPAPFGGISSARVRLTRDFVASVWLQVCCKGNLGQTKTS